MDFYGGMNGCVPNLNIYTDFESTSPPYVFIPWNLVSFLGLFAAIWLVFSSTVFERDQIGSPPNHDNQ